MVSWQKIFSREYSVQYCEIALRCGAKESEGILGGYLVQQAFVPEGRGVQSFYVDAGEWTGVTDSVEAFHARDSKRFAKFKKDFDVIGQRYLDESKKNADAAAHASRPSDLSDAYSRFFRSWRDYCAILWAGWMLNERFSGKAEALLAAKAGAHEGKRLAASVLHPSEKTEIALAHDALSAMNRDGFSEAELAAFHERYAWLSCLDVFNRPWSLDEVRKAVESAKPEKAVNLEPMESVLDRLELDDSEEFVLRAAHDLVYIKDQRDVYRRKGVYLCLPFFQAVAKLAGRESSDVAYWTSEEMNAFLQVGKAPDAALAQRRKDGFLLFERDGSYACYSGKEVASGLDFLGLENGASDAATFVKGIVGSKGSFGSSLVQGTAKIVRTVADLDKVKSGDVMVAITTHPDFVPAMHRACAIVTDEGGLTSHAAIVSREFGIPCVVGTKTATRAFKDGDVIVVDAVTGVVKKD